MTECLSIFCPNGCRPRARSAAAACVGGRAPLAAFLAGPLPSPSAVVRGGRCAGASRVMPAQAALSAVGAGRSEPDRRDLTRVPSWSRSQSELISEFKFGHGPPAGERRTFLMQPSPRRPPPTVRVGAFKLCTTAALRRKFCGSSKSSESRTPEPGGPGHFGIVRQQPTASSMAAVSRLAASFKSSQNRLEGSGCACTHACISYGSASR